jgi:predicted phosphodiesterase
MRVAALYDIHGNLPALDAVLGEAEEERVDLVLFGGDIAWGPQPRPTLERVMGLGPRATALRGNADREVAAGSGIEDGLDAATARQNQWCSAQLTQEQRNWLKALPPTLVVDVDGIGPVLFCHGSPRSDEETITTGTTEPRLREMLDGVEERTVVCGHTHAQFARSVGAKSVINAGSVGLPFGDPGAYWCLLGPRIDLRHTSYDVAAAAASFRREGGPEGAEFAAHALAPPPHETAAKIFT